MQTVDYQQYNNGGVNYPILIGKNMYLAMNSQFYQQQVA